MMTNLAAVVTDVMRAVGYGFNSSGRYGQGRHKGIAGMLHCRKDLP